MLIPESRCCCSKGVCIAIADGIGSSAVSHVASETAVKSFLSDYYCTSETWSVKTSAQRVIAATNSWLHAQTRRAASIRVRPGQGLRLHLQRDGAQIAHGAHLPRRRCARLPGGRARARSAHRGPSLRPLRRSKLSRPGARRGAQVEIDYRAVAIEARRRFVLTTDGVHEHVGASAHRRGDRRHGDDLDEAARAIVRRPTRAAARTTSPCRSYASTRFRSAIRPSSRAGSRAALAPLLEPRMHLRRLPHGAHDACEQPQSRLRRNRRGERKHGRDQGAVDGAAHRPGRPAG